MARKSGKDANGFTPVTKVLQLFSHEPFVKAVCGSKEVLLRKIKKVRVLLYCLDKKRVHQRDTLVTKSGAENEMEEAVIVTRNIKVFMRRAERHHVLPKSETKL